MLTRARIYQHLTRFSISWALTQKLNESGWLDDHKDRAKGISFGYVTELRVLKLTSQRWSEVLKASPLRQL